MHACVLIQISSIMRICLTYEWIMKLERKKRSDSFVVRYNCSPKGSDDRMSATRIREENQWVSLTSILFRFDLSDVDCGGFGRDELTWLVRGWNPLMHVLSTNIASILWESCFRCKKRNMRNLLFHRLFVRTWKEDCWQRLELKCNLNGW